MRWVDTKVATMASKKAARRADGTVATMDWRVVPMVAWMGWRVVPKAVWMAVS